MNPLKEPWILKDKLHTIVVDGWPVTRREPCIVIGTIETNILDLLSEEPIARHLVALHNEFVTRQPLGKEIEPVVARDQSQSTAQQEPEPPPALMTSDDTEPDDDNKTLHQLLALTRGKTQTS